jgi:hypothetical protein
MYTNSRRDLRSGDGVVSRTERFSKTLEQVLLGALDRRDRRISWGRRSGFITRGAGGTRSRRFFGRDDRGFLLEQRAGDVFVSARVAPRSEWSFRGAEAFLTFVLETSVTLEALLANQS